MATSGLLLVAKTKEVHQHLQAQFADRSIKKRYTAVLDGVTARTEKTVSTEKTTLPFGRAGRINLPLCLNPLDRPRQIVSREHGKEAIQNTGSSVNPKNIPGLLSIRWPDEHTNYGYTPPIRRDWVAPFLGMNFMERKRTGYTSTPNI